MSSSSHKHSAVGKPQRSLAHPDPRKLSMVSDFLKRTVSERPYAFILESLAERLEIDKIDRRFASVGIIPIPFDFDLRRLSEEDSVAFMPYCCKPFDCPLNVDYGRKSTACQAIDSKCDLATCTLGKFIKVAKKLGVREFHIIATDGGLFEWLAKKKEEGYTHTIGAACEFAVSYALEVIHGQLGFDGLIVTITGDKCKTKEEYSESETADRDRLTFIDEWTISTLDEIADKIIEGNHREKEKGLSVDAPK